MNVFKKVMAVITLSIPIDTLIIGCMIKDIGLEDSGLLLMGMLVALIGCLYLFIGCKKEYRLPVGIMLFGLVLCLCSFIAIILGLVALITPASYLGGTLLWKSSTKSTEQSETE